MSDIFRRRFSYVRPVKFSRLGPGIKRFNKLFCDKRKKKLFDITVWFHRSAAEASSCKRVGDWLIIISKVYNIFLSNDISQSRPTT